jgi:hypothetical protein
MVCEKTKDRMEYFVVCVTEFAKAFGLDSQKSFDDDRTLSNALKSGLKLSVQQFQAVS